MTLTIDHKCREQAKDKEKYDKMIKFFAGANDKEDMESRALLFIMDVDYPRQDICLAMKAVEIARGWR